jgi:hypothetical protein
MPRCVRPALLVALAALAGCSLGERASLGGGVTCTNSCYCGPRRSPPLLGPAPPPPHTQGQDNSTDCKHCKVINATWGTDEQDCTPRNVMVEIQDRWDRNHRNFTVSGTDEGDSCPGTPPWYLSITTAATEDGDEQKKWPRITFNGTLDMTDCCPDYPPLLPVRLGAA